MTDTTDWKEKYLQLKDEFDKLRSEKEKLDAHLHETEESDSSNEDVDDEESVCDGSPWSIKYTALKQYKQANGDCMVPRSNKELGLWVKFQRQRYTNKLLPQDRIDKLNKIGMFWGKNFPLPKTWNDFFGEWKEHQSTFGSSAPLHEDSELGKWCADQRKQGKRLRKAMPSTLSREQYKQLNDLSFPWSSSSSRKRRRN